MATINKQTYVFPHEVKEMPTELPDAKYRLSDFVRRLCKTHRNLSNLDEGEGDMSNPINIRDKLSGNYNIFTDI
jgi:hypothetical protein